MLKLSWDLGLEICVLAWSRMLARRPVRGMDVDKIKHTTTMLPAIWLKHISQDTFALGRHSRWNSSIA